MQAYVVVLSRETPGREKHVTHVWACVSEKEASALADAIIEKHETAGMRVDVETFQADNNPETHSPLLSWFYGTLDY
ncbi:MAG: hypothetical protein K6U74_01985 [Firmicutes bacterium]|nr:hypothetical protein [Bacillota bacterium]